MQIGYACVSTLEQNVTPQIDQLKDAGCERIFHIFGAPAEFERKLIRVRAVADRQAACA